MHCSACVSGHMCCVVYKNYFNPNIFLTLSRQQQWSALCNRKVAMSEKIECYQFRVLFNWILLSICYALWVLKINIIFIIDELIIHGRPFANVWSYFANPCSSSLFLTSSTFYYQRSKTETLWDDVSSGDNFVTSDQTVQSAMKHKNDEDFCWNVENTLSVRKWRDKDNILRGPQLLTKTVSIIWWEDKLTIWCGGGVILSSLHKQSIFNL